MASMGVATTNANAHNISKLTETLDQYKGKMAEMKEVLRKEERVGQESKRKYEATLSDYDKLQQDYQILGEERDHLKQSNMILDREKRNLESSKEKMEVEKSIADQKYKARIAELESQNSSLEVLLKVVNERNIDIDPLKEHALFLRGKIHQGHINL